MPTRYRESIQERAQGKLVVTVHRDLCLLLYPRPDWEQTELNILNLPSLRPQVRWLQRFMVGYATDVELDGHGRCLLPPELREIAELGRSGMLVGQGNRFELWEEARWNEQRDRWFKQGPEETDSTSLLDSLHL